MTEDVDRGFAHQMKAAAAGDGDWSGYGAVNVGTQSEMPCTPQRSISSALLCSALPACLPACLPCLPRGLCARCAQCNALMEDRSFVYFNISTKHTQLTCDSSPSRTVSTAELNEVRENRNRARENSNHLVWVFSDKFYSGQLAFHSEFRHNLSMVTGRQPGTHKALTRPDHILYAKAVDASLLFSTTAKSYCSRRPRLHEFGYRKTHRCTTGSTMIKKFNGQKQCCQP